MSYDPFVILGISRDASQQEILDAYKAKRAELSEQLFQEGEAGAEAARQIRILDEAYQSAMEIKETENVVESDESSVFVNVTNLIKYMLLYKVNGGIINQWLKGINKCLVII